MVERRQIKSISRDNKTRGPLISESLIKAVFLPGCAAKRLDRFPTWRSISPVTQNFSRLFESVSLAL